MLHQAGFVVFFKPKSSHYPYALLAQTRELFTYIHRHFLKKEYKDIINLLAQIDLSDSSNFSMQAASCYDDSKKCKEIKEKLTALLKSFLNTIINSSVPDYDFLMHAVLANINQSSLYVKVRKLIINHLLDGAPKTLIENKMLQGITLEDLIKFAEEPAKEAVSETIIAAFQEYQTIISPVDPDSSLSGVGTPKRH